jgi:acyl dehydratase
MADPIPLAEYAALEGTKLPASPWLEITQDRVDQFADATNDHQFIHVDPERAGQTPFGGTIAHGYLTLSLLSDLLGHCWPMPEGLAMGLNYGSDKVRYLAPVKVGQRIRAMGTVAEVGEKRPGQWLMKTQVTVEIENETTPALIAEILSMFIVGEAREESV